MYFTPDELAIIKLYLGSYATPRVYVQQHMRDILPYVDDPTTVSYTHLTLPTNSLV